MKIKYLEMSAFGPFKGVESIDFETLNKKQIFLISGPTGAGKTTIFDAISFALFGKASGTNRSDPENIRSHFSSIDTRTYVKLSFTIRGETYEIIRYPKQDRPSKRGTDDVITMQHRAEFFPILDPTNVLTRVGDVNDKINEILGISYDQFRQIVMLPQGEFQKLLLASSDDRTKIFRRIFNTDFFERFQERLKEQADVMKKSVTDDQTRLESYYRQIDMTDSDTELKRIVESEYVHVESLVEELGRINKELGESLKRKKVDEGTMQKTIEEKRTHIRAVEQNNEKLDQKQQANLVRQTLENEKKEIEDDRLKIVRYERALRVKPLKERAMEIKANKDRYQKRALQTKDNITYLKKNVLKLKKDLEEIPEIERSVAADTIEEERLEKTIDRLKTYLEKKNEIQTYEQKITLEQNALKHENEELEKVERQIEVLDKNILDHEDVLGKAIGLMREIQVKEQRIHNDEQVFDLLLESEKQEEKLKTEKVGFEHEHRIFLEKEKEYHEKTRRYLNGQATLLAESLEDGKPCPVCGSIHHPNKVEATDETISHHDHEANKKAYETDSEVYQQALKRLERLKEKLDETKGKIEQTIKKLGYDFKIDKTEIIEQIKARKNEIETLYAEQKRIDETENELKRLKKRRIESDMRQKTVFERKTHAQRTIDRLSGEMDRISHDQKRLEDELNGEKRSLEELKARRVSLAQTKKQSIERIDIIRESFRTNEQNLKYEQQNLEAIEKDITENEKKYEQARQAYEKELFSHFASEEELDRMLELEQQIDMFKARVKTHDDAVLENRQWLTIIEKELTDQNKHDTIPMKDEVLDLEEKQNEIREIIRELDLKHSQNMNLETMIERTYRSSEKARKSYEKVQDIANIARGMRGNKISFERYVLAYFFNEILIVANRKLAKMTSERYTLLRKADRMKGAAQQGLDLVIYDAYTTKTRDVSTLSGGESFKAALALALGLAEIVERNAGGISLETMFIDEGFGTLDAESLDMAIETLLNLNRTGRVVGIISHVQELKDRIEAKITLEVTNEGSRIQ